MLDGLLIDDLQWGSVCADMDVALPHWARLLGLTRFARIEQVLPTEHQGRYRGVPTDVRLSVAFAYFGDIQIEVMQQLNESASPYRDFLQADRSGIQHIGTWTWQYDEAYAALLDLGYEPVYEAAMQGAPQVTTYFDDPGHTIGPMIELVAMNPHKERLYAVMKDYLSRPPDGRLVEVFPTMDAFASTLGVQGWVDSAAQPTEDPA